MTHKLSKKELDLIHWCLNLGLANCTPGDDRYKTILRLWKLPVKSGQLEIYEP